MDQECHSIGTALMRDRYSKVNRGFNPFPYDFLHQCARRN